LLDPGTLSDLSFVLFAGNKSKAGAMRMAIDALKL